MEERSEEDKVTQAPLEVMLGREKHAVNLLVIAKARIWRAKVSDLIGSLSVQVAVKSDNPQAFQNGLNALLVAVPDQIIDLFFEYACELDREAIEEIATDDEIAAGFRQILAVAFPLPQSLDSIVQVPGVQRGTRKNSR